MKELSLAKLAENLKVPLPQTMEGKVIALKAGLIVARLPDVAIGDLCLVARRNRPPLLAEAVSFDADLCLLAPFEDLNGISPHAIVTTNSEPLGIAVGEHLIGNLIDPIGNLLATNSNLTTEGNTTLVTLRSPSPNAVSRKQINTLMETGIRSIDLFTPIGFGQRIGLFAGPGVGKSTLLGMIARNADVDITIIALVGERGREVNEFVDEVLGAKGLRKSIVVVSTSDQSALRRFMAAQTATAIAEHFRSQGKRVLLLVDSLTRVARAIRDVSLASGELPLRQGFTPAVFSELPRLLERSGNNAVGSITAIYTVLTQNDEINDALGEEIKSILDGHIVLSGALANEGLRPAIDITNSVSRLKEKLQSKEERRLGNRLVTIASRIRRDKDIILMGGQADGELQVALEFEEEIKQLLSQDVGQRFSIRESFDELAKLIAKIDARLRLAQSS